MNHYLYYYGDILMNLSILNNSESVFDVKTSPDPIGYPPFYGFSYEITFTELTNIVFLCRFSKINDVFG